MIRDYLLSASSLLDADKGFGISTPPPRLITRIGFEVSCPRWLIDPLTNAVSFSPSSSSKKLVHYWLCFLRKDIEARVGYVILDTRRVISRQTSSLTRGSALWDNEKRQMPFSLRSGKGIQWVHTSSRPFVIERSVLSHCHGSKSFASVLIFSPSNKPTDGDPSPQWTKMTPRREITTCSPLARGKRV